MSKNEAAQNREPASPRYTHLVGRSRGQRPFNRAGVRFDPDFQAIPLSELSPERVERILKEPMIEARLATERDVEKLGVTRRAEYDESIPRSELVRYIVALEQKLARQEDRIARLEADRMADRPPKNVGDIVPGR